MIPLWPEPTPRLPQELLLRADCPVWVPAKQQQQRRPPVLYLRLATVRLLQTPPLPPQQLKQPRQPIPQAHCQQQVTDRILKPLPSLEPFQPVPVQSPLRLLLQPLRRVHCPQQVKLRTQPPLVSFPLVLGSNLPVRIPQERGLVPPTLTELEPREHKAVPNSQQVPLKTLC